MTSDILIRFSLLLVGLIVLGSIACLPLYKWNLRRYGASPLFTKVMWWIPIFGVLLAILYAQLSAAIIVTLFVALTAGIEFIRNRGYKSGFALGYFTLFLLLITHLALWFVYLPEGVVLLAAVCLVSVMSDVLHSFSVIMLVNISCHVGLITINHGKAF